MPIRTFISHASFCLLTLSAALSTSPASAQSSQVCFDLSLRGGSSEICADVHVNPLASAQAATVLAVHGFTETAATWGPLTAEIFARTNLRDKVKRVIAIDLPGHGASEAPVGLPDGLFGDLTINDNVAVVIQTIDILQGLGLGAQVIMGHSMGGLAVQGVQEALLAQGSSLASHGVNGAILLAPVPAGGQQWTTSAPPDLSPFVTSTPELGTYLAISPFIGQVGGGFTTWAGDLVPGTPTLEEMVDYVGLEPITTTLQLVGQIPLPRPSVRQGAFAPNRGTKLSLIALSQDVLVPAVDLDDLYLHLIGHSGAGYHLVDTSEAVHSMHISDPEALLDEIPGLPSLF